MILVVSKNGLIVLIMSAHESLDRREKISLRKAEWYLFYGENVSRTNEIDRELRARRAWKWIPEIGSSTTAISKIFLVFLLAHKHPFCTASHAASMRFWAPSFCIAVDK